MQETSFGSIKVISKEPFIEHLIFHNSGRAHQHDVYEIFTTTKGTGKVIKGDEEVTVSSGSIVVIPPNTDHWMEPTEGQILEGYLTYSDVEPKVY